MWLRPQRLAWLKIAVPEAVLEQLARQGSNSPLRRVVRTPPLKERSMIAVRHLLPVLLCLLLVPLAA